LVLAISAGSWAVFSLLLARNKPISSLAEFFVTSALVCLVISGYFCLQAARPSDHVYPRGEDKAIEYANFYKEEGAAKARFALIFGDSTEQERFVTFEKGRLVNWGTVFVVAAIVAFSLSLFVQLFQLR
jgi:hypothetical protein